MDIPYLKSSFQPNTMNRILSVLLLISILGCSANQSADVPVSTTYDQLVSLFQDWRTFENPPLLNGAPDYRLATFQSREGDFNQLQAKLNAFDTTGWSIPNQVDYHIVWAEMNGYDFNQRILKPWERDPAFYKSLWMSRSDVPAHEGPTHHGTTEIWTHDFPLTEDSKAKLLAELKAIPTLNSQAQENLTGNARELWIAGIRSIEQQANDLATIKGWDGISKHAELTEAIDNAISSTNDFVTWLKSEGEKKDGPSGLGKENYTWYLQHVHLVPLTWEDEVMILKRELSRSWSALKLEEHRNRNLPELEAAITPEAFKALTDRGVKSLISFLDEQDIVTVADYFEPALREHEGSFFPQAKRNFFYIGMHYDPRPLYSHFYHWFELARMDNTPHASPIRREPLLYNIFDSRNEGTATAVEEMFMDAGLYDDDPRVREIVYIMIAQRAARGLGSLYAHANDMTMEEAGGIHSDYTPRGWMKTEKELLLFEQHLYMRQPGYGSSYITGKHLLEQAMAEYARANEGSFELKSFFDQLNSIGSIPIALGQWQMTGDNSDILKITSND